MIFICSQVKATLSNPALLENLKHEILRLTGRNTAIVGDNGEWKLEVQ